MIRTPSSCRLGRSTLDFGEESTVFSLPFHQREKVQRYAVYYASRVGYYSLAGPELDMAQSRQYEGNACACYKILNDGRTQKSIGPLQSHAPDAIL